MLSLEPYFAQLDAVLEEVILQATADCHAGQARIQVKYNHLFLASAINDNILRNHFSYPLPTEQPDQDNITVPVMLRGRQVVGHLHCIAASGGALKWYGSSTVVSATGTAHTRAEAARDVMFWALGRTPAYKKYAQVKWPR